MQPKITGLDQALSNVEKRIYDKTYDHALAGVARVIAQAQQQWPVGERQFRPHSRDLFRIVNKSNGRDRVHLVIENTARDKRGTPYAFYIRSAQVPGAGASKSGMKNAWLVLIRRPTRKMLRDLAEWIASNPFGRG